MPNTYEHERMRWNSMTFQQLETRLTRIRDPQKFNNFLEAARDVGNAHLYTQCLIKMNEFNVYVQGTVDGYLDERPDNALLVPDGTRDEREDTALHERLRAEGFENTNARENGVTGGVAEASALRDAQSIVGYTTVDGEPASVGVDLATPRVNPFAETIEDAENKAQEALTVNPKPCRIVRMRGNKKRKKLLEKENDMKDFRNEFDVEAPRAKGAYLEDAPDIIWTEHGWVLEDKEDAMRCTMQIGAKRSLLIGRNRKDFLKGVKKAGSFMSLDHKNPIMAFEVFSKEFDGTMLDGELTETFKKATKQTILHGQGVETKLGMMEYDKYTTERLGIGDKLGYGVWDCLFYKGVDIRDRQLWKRRKAAEHVIEQLGNPKIWLLKQSLATEENMQAIFNRGKEGAIAKNIYHKIPTDQKTHPGYWKLKGDDKRTVDGFIAGVQEAYGGGSGVKGIKPKKNGKAASFTICMLDGKQESVEVCKMKGNLTDDMVNYGYSEFHRFANRVVEMKVSGWDGARFRWPRFFRFRPDKSAQDCKVAEQIGENI